MENERKSNWQIIILEDEKKGDEKMRDFIHRPAESCNGELYKRSDTASITQLKRLDNNNENTLRFYKNSPDSYSLQIRTYKGIGEDNVGKPRNMIANIHVSKEDIQALMDYVNDNPPLSI